MAKQIWFCSFSDTNTPSSASLLYRLGSVWVCRSSSGSRLSCLKLPQCLLECAHLLSHLTSHGDLFLLLLLHCLDLIGDGLQLSLKWLNFCLHSSNIVLGFDIGYSNAVDLGKLQVLLDTSSGEAGTGDYANCGTEEVLHCLSVILRLILIIIRSLFSLA